MTSLGERERKQWQDAKNRAPAPRTHPHAVQLQAESQMLQERSQLGCSPSQRSTSWPHHLVTGCKPETAAGTLS